MVYINKVSRRIVFSEVDNGKGNIHKIRNINHLRECTCFGEKIRMRKFLDLAECLGISVGRLAGEQIIIPLVAEVTAEASFRFRENEYVELFDIAHLPGITQHTAAHCYALRVLGDSMLPFHKDGDILVVEKDSQKKFRHGDTVVFHKSEGSFIKFLELKGDSAKLRPLDLRRYQETEEVSSFAQMDKVIFVISS